MTSRGIFPRKDYRRGRGLVGMTALKLVTMRNSMLRRQGTETGMRSLGPVSTLVEVLSQSGFSRDVHNRAQSSLVSPPAARADKIAVKSAKKCAGMACRRSPRSSLAPSPVQLPVD